MRYNTRNKRNAVREDVLKLLTDYGYELETARYEVNTWVEGGLKALSEIPRKGIQQALIELNYHLKVGL